MGINDIFSPAPVATVVAPTPPVAPTPAPTVAPVPPGNLTPPVIETVQSSGTAPNGVVPAIDTPPPEGVTSPPTPQSPLDQFSKLWHTDPDVKPKPEVTPTPIDKEVLKKVVADANFTGTVTPEVLAAVAAGGEGATEALQTAMNNVAQTVMMQSTLVQDKLTNQRLEEQRTNILAQLPELVRQHTMTENLAVGNPILSNPALTPIVDMLKSQMALKHPTATAAELSTLTQDFMTALGTMVAPTPGKSPEQLQQEASEMDWNLFLAPQSNQ